MVDAFYADIGKTSLRVDKNVYTGKRFNLQVLNLTLIVCGSAVCTIW